MSDRHLMVTCDVCKAEMRSDTLERHMRRHKPKPCPRGCGQMFLNSRDRAEHAKNCQG